MPAALLVKLEEPNPPAFDEPKPLLPSIALSLLACAIYCSLPRLVDRANPVPAAVFSLIPLLVASLEAVLGLRFAISA
jgi:hypothetical protein